MTDWTPTRRLYNQVDADTLNTYGRDNVLYLAENLPHQVTMWHNTAIVNAGNAIATVSPLATQWYGMVFRQSASADADSFSHSFVCKAGTLALTLLAIKTTVSGLLDWSLDGVSISTGMDFYAGSAQFNQLLTVTGVTVATPGRHVLTGTVNGKNASSGGYDIGIGQLWAILS